MKKRLRRMKLSKMASAGKNRDIEKEEVYQSCGKVGAAKSEHQPGT